MSWSAGLQLHVIVLAQPIKIFDVLNVMVTVFLAALTCSLFRCVPLFLGNEIRPSVESKLLYPPVGAFRFLEYVGAFSSCCIVLYLRRISV
jgi:hypothetical protein